MEIKVKVYLPVTPMAGDTIVEAGANTTVGGEFARVRIGEECFVADAVDGKVYEIELLKRGDGTPGSQSWKARGIIAREKFASMHPSPTR